jgi:hypothetical protein
MAKKRGLGAHPAPLYGFLTPPRLSAPQLRLTGLALIGCLLAACTPMAPRVFLFVAYLLSLCYFPQLYAEVTCSGHSTILIPSLLLLLSCAPSLDHQVKSRSEWPLVLIRIYLASGYFASGMCKLLCGARFQRFWGWGPTLQAYVFDGMWSRPTDSAVVRRLQQQLLTRPWLATALASGSVLFETSFILAPTSDLLMVLCGLGGFAFHFGILLLQGLDFVTFWSPALLAFLVGVPSREPWTAVLQGWAHETGFFLPALIYTALQVLTALTLRDFWLDDILPFSCCPMFMLPRNPFDEWPKWWTMTDSPLSGSTRIVGAMEPLYWSPASPIFSMPMTEAAKLPQKVVWFGATRHTPTELRKFLLPECLELPFVYFANFELSAPLKAKIQAVVAECASGSSTGEPERAWDGHSMADVLRMQDECLELFKLEAAAAQRADAKRKAQ